jgi:hypothetical protein
MLSKINDVFVARCPRNESWKLNRNTFSCISPGLARLDLVSTHYAVLMIVYALRLLELSKQLPH